MLFGLCPDLMAVVIGEMLVKDIGEGSERVISPVSFLCKMTRGNAKSENQNRRY